MLALTFAINACKKTEITTQQLQEATFASADKKGSGNNGLNVTTTSVNVGSAISSGANGSISGGGNSISERGFCYNTSPGPTITNDTARAGSGSGDFQQTLTGLSPATTYYVKAYGIKNGSVYYGNELSFTTLSLGMPSAGVGDVNDIDGNLYHTITLGTQVWMVENLKTTSFRDGSAIPNVTDNAPWAYNATTTTPAYCDYNNNPANSAVYGRLYNLFAMNDVRGIAPVGWHVPSFSEWNTLFLYLGGWNIAGGRMKETGLTHWLTPNTGADNSSGFTGVGTGDRAWSATGVFSPLQMRSSLWSSSSSYTSGSANLFVAYLVYNSASTSMTAGTIGGGQNFGFGIRCIKD